MTCLQFRRCSLQESLHVSGMADLGHFSAALILSLVSMMSWAFPIQAADRVRVPWTESRLIGYPEPPLPYRAVRVYEKMPLSAPVYVRQEPRRADFGNRRLFYIDHKLDGK